MRSTFPFSVAARAAPLVLTTMLAWLPGAQAQEQASPDQEMQSVRVAGVRDPAILPYKKAHDLISAVDRASKGYVQLRIRITSSATKAPIDHLTIALEGEQTHETLAISPDGFVTVPLNQTAYAEGAEFITNQKKKTLRVEFFLLPTLAPNAIAYADIAAAIGAARRALSDVVPWYLRLLMPSIHNVGICYANKQQNVVIRHSGGDTTRAAIEQNSNALNHAVFCANFSAKENFAADSVIVPAPGWEALFN